MNYEVSTGGRRKRLRQATDAIHRRIDDTVSGAGFLTTPERYCTYLVATKQARQPVEDKLERNDVVNVFPAWPERRISALIDADLTDLDVSPLKLGLSDGEAICREPMSRGALFGSLYVLEGSALGAQLIARRVATFGMTHTFGARHLAAQTAGPKAWPKFLSLLEEIDLSPSEDDECVAAALSVFDHFEHCYGIAAQL